MEATLQESMGPEAHILNLYEDLSMPISELYEIITAVMDGALTEVQEKMDGQNITFTVIEGVLLFFSKGVTLQRVRSGIGMTKESIVQKYSTRPSVRDSFVSAYETLESVVTSLPWDAYALFRDGEVVIETAFLTPQNPNTVVYDIPNIRFIQASSLAPETEVDQELYRKLVDAAQKSNSRQDDRIQIGEVPYLRLQRSLNRDDYVKELEKELDDLLERTKLERTDTVGDIVVQLVLDEVRHLEFVPLELMEKVAVRFATGRKGILSKQEFLKYGDVDAWQTLQELESDVNTFVAGAIVPLESIIQKLGAYAFRNLEFALASNDRTSGTAIQRFVGNVRQAFEQSRILANPRQLARIKVALDRIGDRAALFEKATEGIVFRWRGKSRKLTGMFTPINRLRGFFVYDSSPAKIVGED